MTGTISRIVVIRDENEQRKVPDSPKGAEREACRQRPELLLEPRKSKAPPAWLFLTTANEENHDERRQVSQTRPEGAATTSVATT